MKKSILIGLFMLGTFTVQAQIPNFNFEDVWWNNSPGAWMTTNIGSVFPPVTNSYDAYADSFAVKGEVISYAGMPFPPYLSNVDQSAGFPLTQSYTIMQGWLKTMLLPGDFFYGRIIIYDGATNPIGEGSFVSNVSDTSWNQFTALISYSSPAPAAYGTIFFTITDSTLNKSGQVGSYFILDELSLSGSVGMTETTEDFTIPVYPNPAESVVGISVPDAGEYRLRIYDTQGKTCYDYTGNKQKLSIVVEDFIPGLYFVSFERKNLLATTRLVVL